MQRIRTAGVGNDKGQELQPSDVYSSTTVGGVGPLLAWQLVAAWAGWPSTRMQATATRVFMSVGRLAEAGNYTAASIGA